MGQRIFSYILHIDGFLDDSVPELLAAGNRLDPDASQTAIVVCSEPDVDSLCTEVSSYFPEVWKICNPGFSYPNAEEIRVVLTRIIPKNSIVLVPHDHFGMDLSPGLSVKLDAVFLSDVVAFEPPENGCLRAIRQEYSGQVSVHVNGDISRGAVITVRPGCFEKSESEKEKGTVIDKSADALGQGFPQTARRFLKTIEAEKGDVDISRSDILVSVGRGIGDADNLEMVYELADAMGADVSCSRPVVDSKWLEKARQVGSSGQTVKPKVYMALGISGSFQHVAGIKGNPFIVAINRNSKAPIFQIADVGVKADILQLVPRLSARIRESKK